MMWKEQGTGTGNKEQGTRNFEQEIRNYELRVTVTVTATEL